MKLLPMVVVAVALALVACSPLGSVVAQMSAVTPAATVAIDALELQYKLDLQHAADPEKVRDCYAPAFEAYRAFLQSHKDAQDALALAASLENAGAVADAEIATAVRLATKAMLAFDLFNRLRKGGVSCGFLKRSAGSTAGQPA